MMEKLKMHHQSTDDTLNLSPKTIISKEYDYRTLVQKRDRWQPAYIINKYFPKEGDKQ
jgi:hypothetical protein